MNVSISSAVSSFTEDSSSVRHIAVMGASRARPSSVRWTVMARRSCGDGRRVTKPASCMRVTDLETVEWSRPTHSRSSVWVCPSRSKSCMSSSS
ncbi:hypothetical protein SGM_4196 [Streptomyces griseoaurantiacus M045]|uniref:Uncharacterized protein n=1 Tax=Streptomyces griseoaurantiacus M045 TaxID=996637 RepID=F3NLU1_9ACTN|nr:hypothetical protein SGM_4196 [Streptomyces griseoaurantiacus M045]